MQTLYSLLNNNIIIIINCPPFWILLAVVFFLLILETLFPATCKNAPSAGYVSAAYHACKDADVFRKIITSLRPPLWSIGQSFWLQIQRSRVRFPVLPDFLSSSGSGTGSTQPREVN